MKMDQEQEQEALHAIQKNLESTFGGFPVRFSRIPFSKQAESEASSSSSNPEEEDFIRRMEDFHLKPKELRNYLDRYVIQQAEAKKVLSVAICDHYNHVRDCLRHPEKVDQLYLKQNVLVLGPTGVGKTYLIRNIARRIGVPFVKADATKFSETGYVGGDVEDLVRDLVKAANGNVALAQYGIIYIDEIDKIASVPSSGKDVSGRGVQVNLLKLMEETDVNLVTPTDMLGQVQTLMAMQRGEKRRKTTINTRHILFIFSGAFDALPEIIQRRLGQGAIGFRADSDSFKASSEASSGKDAAFYLHQVQTQDFIQFGFEPEFVGRIPVRVACDPLNQEDLLRILTDAECSILQQAKADFEGYDIHMDITREAMEKIAAQAEAEKTGARGLMTIFERILRNFKFELPSSGIHSFEVTTDTVDHPERALKELLLANQSLHQEEHLAAIHAYEHAFFQENHLRILFSEDGIEELIRQSVLTDQPIPKLCASLFQDCVYGLKMIAQEEGCECVTLDRAFVQNPSEAISERVRKNFQSPSRESTNDACMRKE